MDGHDVDAVVVVTCAGGFLEGVVPVVDEELEVGGVVGQEVEHSVEEAEEIG